MAPWPEQGNEPKAPDKICGKTGENALLDTSRVSCCASDDAEVSATLNKSDDKQVCCQQRSLDVVGRRVSFPSARVEEKNPNVSNLDDGQLKALLDEAITYKCPKDREGKSDLFRELLQEVEADESDSRRSGCTSVTSGTASVASSRCYSGNRRRGIPSRRDVTAVSERQTRGGSLQNLVHAASSEFDTTGFGGHGPAGRRRGARQKEQRATSVSARQREGGSLPSNVNVGGDCLLEDSRRRRRDPASAPVEDLAAAATAPARCGGGPGAIASLPVCHSSSDTDSTAVGDSVCGASDGGRPIPTSTISDRRDIGVAGGSDCEIGTELEVVQRSETAPRVPNFTSHATLEVGGKSISNRDSEVDTTVTLPLGLLQWSLPVVLQREKGSASVPVVNGVDQSPLQLASSYNSVKCIMGSVARSGSGAQEERTVSTTSAATKGNDAVLKRSVGAEAAKSGVAIHNNYPMQMQHLSVLSLPPNTWIATSLGSEQVGRVFQGSKDFPSDIKAKSLDENGNAVNRLESGQSNERKSKTRRTKTNNESNFIMSHNIEGYRGDRDLDTLIKFIESDTEGKGKAKSSSHSNGPLNFNNKQQRNNLRKDEIVAGTKPRKEQKSANSSIIIDEDEEKPAKGTRSSKQIPKEHRNGPTVDKSTESKLKKSNSMEEISNRKIEDLTAGPESGGLHAENISVQRRMKKQTLQEIDSVGRTSGVDRRSWGPEDHQYSCNEAAVSSTDDSSSSHPGGGRKRRGPVSDDRRRPERDATPAPASGSVSGTGEETGFCVFESKKRRKKRRSSSGIRSNPSSGVTLFADDGRRSGGGQYNTTQYPAVCQGSRESGYHQKKTFNGNSGFPPHDRTADDSGGSVVLYQYRRPRSPEHCRRKSTSSVPPSDKSDSSDLDSVHSLPVSSTTARPTLDQTSTSSGSTPQASYADIAKMASVNVTTSQGVYGGVGFGNSKWPAVSVPKGVVISPPTTSSTSTPSSNPQFITGPKVNIGAPPVSGSKLGNNPASPNSSSANSSHSNASTNAPNSSTSGDDTSPASSVNQDTDPVEPSAKFLNPIPDSRTKKDAMTNTTTDFKLVPPYSAEVESNPKTHAKPPEHPVNILLDSEYPSLEESLVCDKAERKLGKLPCQQAAPLQSSVTGNCDSLPQGQQANSPAAGVCLPNQVPTAVQDTKVLNTVLPTVLQSNPLQNQSCPSSQKSPCQDSASQEAKPTSNYNSSPQPEQHTISSVTQNHEMSPTPCIYPTPVSQSTVPPPAKHRSVSRKVSSVSCPRPPVIIMNDDDSGTNYGDSAPVELTFGFEVNEQLLLLDGEEASGSDAVNDLSSPLENDAQISSDETGASVPRVSPVVDKTGRASSVGDDFSARFREPAVQAGNYDKIVDFVGMAWDDVLKEMSSTAVQSGAKVRYYSGQ
ncbi:mucin-19-like isoform X1 [Schistocerca serialis cubense]|uniref:mucin-19-like isoform X1 n=1 Tax=Schistocerca serialis cubense TaxID=2023355 RepID=UPI00214EA6E4|nr:mucin-19-like isoform X1 [Schistocerca serialis cubense]